MILLWLHSGVKFVQTIRYQNIGVYYSVRPSHTHTRVQTYRDALKLIPPVLNKTYGLVLAGFPVYFLGLSFTCYANKLMGFLTLTLMALIK